MNYLTELKRYAKEGKLSQELYETLHTFYFSYVNAALANGYDSGTIEKLLVQLLDFVIEQIAKPFVFEHYHHRIMKPIDYYHYGLDFIRPLVILKTSKVLHLQNVDKISEQLAKGENVILLANHQTELDPQAISLLLEKTHPKLAEELILVAGHRVVNDPLAVPFSKGRNLLCIYSKKYIEINPNLKAERQQHNQRTMNRMGQLLAEGGKCIYVAPSGGRDRRDLHGIVQVAPFDPQSIELFSLIAQRASKPTHFYPLALSTYHLLPPPDSIKQKLGESRHTKATPVHLAFGSEVDLDNFPGSDTADKKERRELRAKYIWQQVCQDYQLIKD